MSAFDAYCDLEGSLSGTVLYDEPMARHTSYRIGGPASLYIECDTIADINRSLEVIKAHSLPWCVVGKGSNLLVADAGFKGAVLSLGKEFKNYSLPDDGDGLIVVGGAVILSALVQATFKGGYSGLEFCVGIPGTVGAAVFMNAGSGKEWIGSVTESVTVLKAGSGLVCYQADEIPFGYRSSGIDPGQIIVEAKLRIKQGHMPSIRAKMEGALQRRRRTQPLNLPNAGSVFRNPDGAYAGSLIESLGLKGYRLGGAQVSELHANFIVNDNNASAQDVLDIIVHVQQKVKQELGYDLRPEIRFIGFS